jgi:hypothetical protein
MDTIQPTIRIDFEDGTSSNVIRITLLRENKAFLESISGLKYGQEPVDMHTWTILNKLKETIPVDEPIMDKIIKAAETVLVGYYLDDRTATLFFDEERDELLVYITESQDSSFDYVARVTLMIRTIVYDYNTTSEDLFVSATMDLQSLAENLKYFENKFVSDEDYEGAAIFRDEIKIVESKINGTDTFDNNRRNAA